MATKIVEQRAQAIKYIEQLFAKQLEILLGEPFVVQIKAGSDFINPSVIHDGFEKSKHLVIDYQKQSLKKRMLARQNEGKIQAQLTFVWTETAKYFNFSPSFLMVAKRGSGGTRDSFDAIRMAVFFVSRKMTLITMVDIAKFLAFRDHSNILAYKKTANQYFDLDAKWRDSYIKYEKYMMALIKKKAIRASKSQDQSHPTSGELRSDSED